MLQQLKHRISWAHLAFNGTPTHPSIYRASLSNANGVVCPCAPVLPLHRGLSLVLSASDPLKSGSVFCRPISQWCWILEILLSRKKIQEIRFDWLLVAQFLRRNRENGAIQLVEKGAKKYCFLCPQAFSARQSHRCITPNDQGKDTKRQRGKPAFVLPRWFYLWFSYDPSICNML